MSSRISYTVQFARRIARFLVGGMLGALALAAPRRVHAALPGAELFAAHVDGAYLCPVRVVQRDPGRCPPYGPGTRDVRVRYLSARLPDPLPALPVTALPQPEGAVTGYTYGHIARLPASTYRHPAEAVAGLPPLRTFQSNINWVSVVGQVDYEGEAWLQINAAEYIRAAHVDFPSASRFQGVVVTTPPDRPFVWLRRETAPAAAPGGPPRGDLILPRRTVATVFASEVVNGRRWDMIGPDQWVAHDWVAQVTPVARPGAIPPGAKWLHVDTYEQVLVAYEGDRMVYATLITAGKADLTPLGLFRIFRKVRAALMESWDRPMDDVYWFYLEDVEHAQFFNERISFHAAYWHDYFGTSRSNGCVNLAPLDARWLYAWTDPQLPPGGSWVTAESAGEGETWVWVVYSGGDAPAKPRE